MSNYEEFQRLLENIPDRSIHSVLHSVSKFQDGVFSKDRSAIEHVHSENPKLATRLVHIAKRQGGTNGTTTAPTSKPPPPTTTLVAPTTPKSATAVATSNGAVVFSSSGGGLVTLSSSKAVVSFTPVTSSILQIFTRPDGSLSTSTSVTIVNAPVTGTIGPPTGTAGAGASGTGNPSLQSGAATPSRGHLKELALMMGGAAAVAMAL